MTPPRTYPNGVPSWVDTEQPDSGAAGDFYGRLFGWTFTTVSPPGAPWYAVASLAGREVAGLGTAPQQPAVRNTYIAVDDLADTAARAAAAGAEIIAGPVDIGEAGRMGFYADLFGWSIEDLGVATLIRCPGYGDHLEATVDPDIRHRQEAVVAPPGFEDAVAWLQVLDPGAPAHWHVTFAVEDRDATAATADRLGAEIMRTEDTQWTRTALVRDPQGAVFTASQFTPPR